MNMEIPKWLKNVGIEGKENSFEEIKKEMDKSKSSLNQLEIDSAFTSKIDKNFSNKKVEDLSKNERRIIGDIEQKIPGINEFSDN